MANALPRIRIVGSRKTVMRINSRKIWWDGYCTLCDYHTIIKFTSWDDALVAVVRHMYATHDVPTDKYLNRWFIKRPLGSLFRTHHDRYL